MSVIGTTLKQPRVFAHDAVALQDLPGCVYAGVGGIDFVTGSGDAGSGFEVNSVNGQTYQTADPNGSGNGAVICVTAVDGSGAIIAATICSGSCSAGSSYSIGDLLTVIWEPSDTYTAGTNSTGLLQVDALSFTAWDYGCPFSPIENRLTEAEIAELNYILPTPPSMPAFKQKDLVKWNCGGEGECDYKTFNPGAALYIGDTMTSLTVIMESGNKATYTNVPAGSFMPVLCLTVCAAVPATEGVNPKAVILALF